MNNGSSQSYSGLLSRVLPILRCPVCGSCLKGNDQGVACDGCGRVFPEIGNVIRFVEPSNYANSFGFQWTRFAKTQLDRGESGESERDFRERTGLTPEDLAGKLVLDVGCGMGRFADIATRWGAFVVGVDLSRAAEVAAQNLKDREAVFFQADVFALPFAAESFDYIYSIGVLHHTPDCERAFKVLPALLKPGGTIAIWLYSGYNRWYRMSDVYRRATSRMSPRFLLGLCQVARPLYHIHNVLRRIPLVGRPASGMLRLLLPTNLHRDPTCRVLDTFDWYSPRYQSKHTYEEVFRWFEACGLGSLHVLKQAISVRGMRSNQENQRFSVSLDSEDVSHSGSR